MFRIDRESITKETAEDAFVIMMPTRPVPHVLPAQHEQVHEVEADAIDAPQEAPAEGEAAAPVDNEALAKANAEAAQATLEQARAEADALLRQAYEEAEAIKREAFDEAYEAGSAQAAGDIAEERRMQDAAFIEMLNEVQYQREAMLDGLEGEVLDLCMSIVRKILPNILYGNDDAFMALVRGALSHMKSEGKITVRVNPAMFERYFASGSAFFAMDSRSITVSVVGDPAMDTYGCVVESDGETINASVESQLKTVEIAFKSDESVMGHE